MTATRRDTATTPSDALLRLIAHRMRTLRTSRRRLPAPRRVAGTEVAGTESVGEARDVTMAERIAESLARLVVETAHASAADRAKVRAAVHYFVLSDFDRGDLRRSDTARSDVGRAERGDGDRCDGDRCDGAGPERSEGLGKEVRVVNEILAELGRDDLVIRA